MVTRSTKVVSFKRFQVSKTRKYGKIILSILKSGLKATHRAHGVIEKMMEKDPDKRVTLNEVTRALSCVETMPILKRESIILSIL